MPKSVDLAEVRRAAGVLFEAEQVCELRALDVSTPNYRRSHIASGYFNDLDKLVGEAGRVAQYAGGVYTTLNPVNPALLARSANRIKAVSERDTLTGDRDILGRRWLPFDLDPVRPSGISSSQAEHEAALTRAADISRFMSEQGFSEPVLADSGNGVHLLYPIDLPAEDGGLVKRTLEAVSLRFSDEQVKVDTAVFNPARICKLYGTLARKGDDMPDRPHRIARLLQTPESLDPVSNAVLEKLAASIPLSKSEVFPVSRTGAPLDVRELLDKAGLAYRGPLSWNGGQKYVLEVCPFNSDHRDRSAYVVQFASGALAAGCHHASCQGKGWDDLRKMLLSDKPKAANRLPAAIPKKTEPASETIAQQSSKFPSAATQLAYLASEQGKFFHTPQGAAYALIQRDGHWEVQPVRSAVYREYLIHSYWQQSRSVLGSQALQDSINLIAAQAVFDGPRRPVSFRMGYKNGNLYIDLADEHWQAVEVSPLGWQVLPQSPVAFHRTRNTGSLPAPQKGGSLDALLSLINLPDPAAQRLLIAYLLGAFQPGGPYPILALYGEHGSAKSSLSRLIKRTLDPVTPLLRSLPRNEHDLLIAAEHNLVLVFDNISRLQPWQSDAFCRLSTGGGFGTRKLYSDAEEIVLNAQRPVVLNGISEMVTRGDLLDRTIILELPTISDSRRKNERDFWATFHQQQPLIFGALLNVVSSILRRLPGLQTPTLPRMADFAAWVTAAEPALGWKPGTFLRDYADNHARANTVVIESSPLGNALVAYLDDLRQTTGQVQWRGTASALWQTLERGAPDLTLDGPTTPQHLSGELRRLAPNLRLQGVDLQFDERSGHNRERVIRIDFANLDGADADLQAVSGEGMPPEEYGDNSSSAGVRDAGDEAEDHEEFDL